MNKKPIYVFGHKNPDTDSVCAAISFSYLKNKLGYNTKPAILGPINNETKYALNYFKFKTPYHLNDVKLQIKDVSYHKKCYIDEYSTIKETFDYMNKNSLTGICVTQNKNKYYGYISLREIADLAINGDFHTLNTSYKNILKILNGKKILKYDNEIKGLVYVSNQNESKNRFNTKQILITTDKEEVIKEAINSKVKLIILGSNLVINSSLIELAKKNHVSIIRTSYNPYEVGKIISLSNYIKNYVRNDKDIVTFSEIDYLSDFKEKSKLLKHNNYPIVNSKNDCLGLLTLTDINLVDRKKVILVDHNNTNQSVYGLEEADILEIIDHHNIGDIVTKKPINFRNSLCGSVCTIIYEMFIENNVSIPSDIAGLLMSAIISDTLLLSSPTTTQKDKIALENLSKIAHTDYTKYGVNMLKQAMSIKGLKNEDLLYKDFKTYKVNDNLIGIGQILVTDIKSIKKRFNELSSFLDEVAEKEKYRVITLFVTDFFKNKSYCLYNKSGEDVIQNSFDLDKVYEGVMLDGVLSRKVQIAPYIMDALD